MELDGLWTRTGGGREELKVARDERGAVFLSFGEWEQVVNQLYARGLGEPVHMVSDGDPAIAGAIELVYGPQVPHQLCQFHLLQEYRRNLGKVGWAEAKALLQSQDREEAQYWAKGLRKLTGGRAADWCDSGDGTNPLAYYCSPGAIQSRVAAAGAAGHLVVAPQPHGIVSSRYPPNFNHLIGNAIKRHRHLDEGFSVPYNSFRYEKRLRQRNNGNYLKRK
jgi:hypothetical protein